MYGTAIASAPVMSRSDVAYVAGSAPVDTDIAPPINPPGNALPALILLVPTPCRLYLFVPPLVLKRKPKNHVPGEIFCSADLSVIDIYREISFVLNDAERDILFWIDNVDPFSEYNPKL